MFDCSSLVFPLELELKVFFILSVLSLSLANFLAASPGSLQTIKQQK